MRDIPECHCHRAQQKLGHRALETCIYVPLKPSLPHLCHRGTLGESLVLNSTPRSSCGVTRPDELYTLIFKLGRGSSRGELVIGILSETSWRAYTGPRYMAAAFVKSGGTVSRSAGIRKKRKKVNKEEKTGTWRVKPDAWRAQQRTAVAVDQERREMRAAKAAAKLSASVWSMGLTWIRDCLRPLHWMGTQSSGRRAYRISPQPKNPEQMRLRSHLNRRMDPLLDNKFETRVFKKGWNTGKMSQITFKMVNKTVKCFWWNCHCSAVKEHLYVNHNKC